VNQVVGWRTLQYEELLTPSGTNTFLIRPGLIGKPLINSSHLQQHLLRERGISAPQAVSTPDPEYTEEARRAKTQGTCILWLIVDAEGHPRDIRVVRGLGFGLDAKAIEAVKQWRFEPAKKDGKPVNVQISVEVGFRLF
jgi:TonB family protein